MGLSRKFARTLCASAVAAGAILGIGAGQASAATGCTDNSGYACGYYYTAYSGDYYRSTGNVVDFSQIVRSAGGTWNDRFSSLYNAGGSCSITVYYNASYQGTSYTISRGTGVSALGNVGLGNSVSSWKWC